MLAVSTSVRAGAGTGGARPPPRLYAEGFSPWCERARWALDHHALRYREVEQVPLVAELTLRVALRRPARRVTMPLFVDDGIALMGSDDIARYADRLGQGSPLFPSAHEAGISRWMQRSETLMTSGRALLLPRLGDSPEALREQLPRFVPAALRGPLRWMGSLGVRHLVEKYGTRGSPEALHEENCRATLDEARTGLGHGRRYLVGEDFSYADLTMGAALQFVLPVAETYISLGTATRDAWTATRLAEDYADLLAWRDALYAAHR